MHQIEYLQFPFSDSESKILKQCSKRADSNGDYKGQVKQVYFHLTNKVFDSRQEARAWMEERDEDYLNFAACYYEPKEIKTNRYKELKDRVEKTSLDYGKKAIELYPKTLTSKFVGCKSCESKLNREKLGSNKCPVCGQDLRPESWLKRINAAKTAKVKAEKALADYKKKQPREQRWLVKIEYHC